MKVYIEKEGRQVPIDPSKLKVNGITLEDYMVVVKDAEKKLKAFEVTFKKLHEDYIQKLDAQEEQFKTYVLALRDAWSRIK